MKQPDTYYIQKTLDMAEKMILLAHKGEHEREDKGCGQLFGVLLDLANKIKTLAVEEQKKHARMR